MFCFLFTSKDEQDLANLLIKFAQWGFPLSKKKVLNLAYQYAERNGRKGFSKLTRQTERVWLKGFLKHHPEIRITKAHNLSVNRAMCANKSTVDKFFNFYEKIVRDYHIELPMNIWNCDKSSVQNMSEEQEVLGVTGEKISNVTSKE